MRITAKVLMLIINFLLFFNICIYAQEGKIQGFVFDSKSREPLIGANVYLEGTSLGAATNLNGKYTIRRIPVGNYQLVVSYIGYVTQKIEINVQQGQTLEQVITLDYQIIAGEVIEVTAQAEGQLSAINQQRTSLRVTSVVAAERIQEVPDANAAESVGRLPGVSLKRSSGEGNEVVIRGLQPRLNLITINNIRMPSTNEYNTAVGLAGISQYMLDGIEVRKSLTAEDDADVVGGIVDLKLATAPSGFRWNVIVEDVYNGLTNNYGSYRGSIQGSNRFFDNSLGIIAQVNIEQADRTNHALSAGFNKDQRTTDNRGVFLTNGTYQLHEITRDRLGINMLIDYKLPKGKIQLNSIYNKFDEDRWERNQNFSVASSAIGMNKVHNSKTISNYTIINGLSLETEIFNFASFDFSASMSKSSRDENNNSLNFIYDQNISEPIDPEFTDNTYGKTAYDIIPYFLDEKSNYQFSSITQSDATFEENENTFQSNLKIPFILSTQLSGSVKLGGKMRFKDREYDYGMDGGNIHGGDDTINLLLLKNNPDLDWPYTWQTLPPSRGLPAYPLYSDETNKILKDRVTLKWFSDRNFVDKLTKQIDALHWGNLTWLNLMDDDIFNDYNGDEKYFAGYVMTDLKWKKSVSLNMGLRYEQEETNYQGFGVIDQLSYATLSNIDSLSAAKRTNNYLLPSATLRYNYADWGDIRVAYSKSLARPEYYAFIPHYAADFRTSFSTAAGNPHLKPAVSENFDLIFSFYNNYIGLFTLGGFYKEIDDFFYTLNIEVIDPEEDNKIHGYENITVLKGQYISVWFNNIKTASIKGLELDWQTHFWYLPVPLNGLVLTANYTKISSHAYYFQSGKEKVYYGSRPWEFTEVRVDSFQTGSLIDQPNDIFNVSLGYDYKDFSMRLAYYYQGKTLSWKSNDVETDGFTQDYSRLDLSVRQKLPIGGLSAQFLLSNITNEDEEAYTYTKQYNNSEQYYGTTASLGLRYEF